MKPLLSELFLTCSGMHSPIRANRYPLTTITGAQRASGQTHSRARSHQGDADLRADRSTAYLVSCIRVRSAHGNSLDHLVGGDQQPAGTVRPSAFAVLMLRAVTNLVAACTGRSAGLAPFASSGFPRSP